MDSVPAPVAAPLGRPRRLAVIVARVVVVAMSAFVMVWLTYWRPAQMRWGATAVEATRPLPGDKVVFSPSVNATRAITIAAPPERVWPWLVQMGTGRAGFYASDWLDNNDQPSASRILPEFQSLHAGDIVPTPQGQRAGYLVKGFEVNRYLLWVVRPNRASWCWSLSALPNGGTRLVARFRLRHRWLSPEIFTTLAAEARDAWTVQDRLRAIKARAEGPSAP
jgi:hypothetical protein